MIAEERENEEKPPVSIGTPHHPAHYPVFSFHPPLVNNTRCQKQQLKSTRSPARNPLDTNKARQILPAPQNRLQHVEPRVFHELRNYLAEPFPRSHDRHLILIHRGLPSSVRTWYMSSTWPFSGCSMASLSFKRRSWNTGNVSFGCSCNWNGRPNRTRGARRADLPEHHTCSTQAARCGRGT